MTQPTVPSPSPWLRVLAALAAVGLIGASIVLSSITPAAAAGLEAFGSCDELRAHVADAQVGTAFGGGDGVAVDSSEGPTSQRAAPATAGTADSAKGAGGTNTQVADIDELDLVEVLGDGRILAVRDDRIVLVDAAATTILASLPTGATSAQLTVDEERATVWAVTTDWQSTTLTRAVLDGDAFADVVTWTVAGRLVDLRRDGDTVQLVAVDDEILPVEPGPAQDPGPLPGIAEPGLAEPEPGDGTGGTDDEALPFAGTSPVPCDEVLHSPLPGGPATTLVATFAATGPLAPVAATEIVGAGDNVLLTETGLYVSTPSYDDGGVVTGIHRFDVDGLTLTGSGSVTGRLLNQFSLDEHGGHLRAAVTVGDGFFIGRPMPVDGPMPLEGDVEITVGAIDAGAAAAPETEPLNEIVTFDLAGSLDVVGRSARFGHEGETIHGIRFAGDVAYAVTFRQTDPLYVFDLSQPAMPRVLGELEIPGFSAYLHPISDTRVVGFGPGPDGGVLARLFDVGDPAAPRLVDTVTVGADSPIVYDHHALRTVGDRLVVAANEWVSQRPSRCGPLPDDQAELERLYLQIEELYRPTEGRPTQERSAELDELERRAADLSRCVHPEVFPRAHIVTLTPTETGLGLVAVATDAGEAWRVLPLGEGYLIVGPELTRVGATGTTEAVLD